MTDQVTAIVVDNQERVPDLLDECAALCDAVLIITAHPGKYNCPKAKFIDPLPGTDFLTSCWASMYFVNTQYVIWCLPSITSNTLSALRHRRAVVLTENQCPTMPNSCVLPIKALHETKESILSNKDRFQHFITHNHIDAIGCSLVVPQAGDVIAPPPPSSSSVFGT